MRWREGDGLGFVPDGLLGDDPEGVKAGLRAAYARIADELEFEALLLAHGGPMASGGRRGAGGVRYSALTASSTGTSPPSSSYVPRTVFSASSIASRTAATSSRGTSP